MKLAYLLFLFTLIVEFSIHSQTLPGKYHSSWIGNTFGGKNSATGGANAADPSDKWVQDYIDCMLVTEDGTCYTSSVWDEAHREYGIYKDGDVLGNKNMKIACDTVGGFSINGTTITGNGKTITDAGKPSAIAMGRGFYEGKLLVADNGQRKQILVYDISSEPSIIETIGVEGGIAADFTPGYDFPQAINAPAYPAKNYPPGFYHPLKLWGLTGIGCDTLGRIFVSTSEMGSGIRCFKKADGKWILDWRLEGYFFVDNVWYDENTDAAEIYGVQEHFRLDFSQTEAGKEWSIIGYTLDSYNYPEDPRGIEDIKAGHEHGLTSIVEREINGTRYLWSQGMTCQPPVIFKFKPGTDIAVPCGMFFPRDHRIYDLTLDYWWPPQRLSTDQGGTMFWSDLNNDGKYTSDEYSMLENNFDGGDFFVDKEGNLWQGGNPIRIWKPAFESNGNITYSDNTMEEVKIIGVPGIGKLKFQEDYDRLVVLTTACRDIDGGKMYIIDNWSKGNRTARYVADLTGTKMTAWTVAGDYAFHGGQDSRAKVWVTDLTSGQMIGTMTPDASCGGVGRTGWIDISSGIQAYKRKASGEYLVFVEDDYLSRVILYRWCPTGDCSESDMKVSLAEPKNGEIHVNFAPLQLKADVSIDTSQVSKVEFFINDILVGQSVSAPFETHWNNPTLGYAVATACATSSTGIKSYSPSTVFRISDGSPEVQLNLSRTIYSIADSIILNPKVQTIDSEIDSVIFYAGNNQIFTEKDSVYAYTWNGLTAGSWNMRVKAVDKEGRIGWSQTIIIFVTAWAVVDDTDSGWVWSGYNYDACGTCYNGSAHSTNVAGDSAVFQFKGTDLEAYCETWEGGGEVEIYIDEVLQGSFSQAVKPYGGANIFAKITGLPDTKHVAKFVSTSTDWTGIDYIRFSADPPPSGTLKGSVAFNTNEANLTKLGTADWKHFSNNDHKGSGNRINSISDYSVISGQLNVYNDDLRNISWTDGTPTPSSSNNKNGVYVEGISNGFSFMVPAGDHDDTLRVFVGGWNSGGTLTAHILNGGTADYTNTTPINPDSWYAEYTIIYNARQPGNSLLITWVQSAGTGNVTLKAATLGKEDTSTGTIAAINASSTIILYPNPLINTDLTIKTDGMGSKVLKITDVTGKTVYTSQFSSNEIKVPYSSLFPGIYFVNLKYESKISNCKLIVR